MEDFEESSCNAAAGVSSGGDTANLSPSGSRKARSDVLACLCNEIIVKKKGFKIGSIFQQRSKASQRPRTIDELDQPRMMVTHGRPQRQSRVRLAELRAAPRSAQLVEVDNFAAVAVISVCRYVNANLIIKNPNLILASVTLNCASCNFELRVSIVFPLFKHDMPQSTEIKGGGALF